MAAQELTVERTGEVHSIASSQFLVTYPDGSMTTIWSPPWHEMTPEEEHAAAIQKAKELFSERLKAFRERFPICQHRSSGLWGWRRILASLDLRGCGFLTEDEARADRDATIKVGKIDSENGQPY